MQVRFQLKSQAMSNQTVKLEFTYTEAEYLAAARLLTFRDAEVIFRIVLFSVFLMGAVSILVGLFTDYPWWAACIATALFLAAIYYNALVQQTRKYFRGEPKFRNQYELTFSAEGITFKTAQIDAKLAWSLYTKVLEVSDVYLLIYGKDIRMMTLIPTRVFRNSIQENAFRELIDQHITSRTGTPKLKAREASADEYKPPSLDPPDWR